MNKALFTGIVFSLCVTGLNGQGVGSLDGSLDSLKAVLGDSRGMARYELAFRIAYDLFDVDNPEAVKYAEEAFAIAGQLGDSATIVRSGRIYGQLLWRVGELNKSIDLMGRLIGTAERCNLEKDLRFLANSLAIACTIRGQYDKALDYSFRSLEIREQRGDKTEIALAQNVVGSTFYALGIYDRAAEFLKKSLATDSSHEYIADLKITLALCYISLGYIEESSYLINIVIDNHNEQIKPRTWPRIYYCLGLIDWQHKRFQPAQKHLKNSYHLAKAVADKNLMIDCLAKLGDIYLSSDDLAAAEKVLLECDSLAVDIGYRNGTEAANLLLSKLYTLKEDYVNASIAKSKVIALRDSTISQGVFNNIFRYQFDYYQKQNTKTIAMQAELLSLKETTIKYQFILNVVSSACVLLLIVVVGLLYRRNQLKKRIALDLEERVRERTSDLRAFDESLRRSQLEKKYVLDGIARQVNTNLATLKGLSVVATTYTGIPAEFAKNIDKTSDALMVLLHFIAHVRE